MLVEKQGVDECMLATIAALAGRTLDETRRIACKAARVRKWHSLFNHGNRHDLYRAGVLAVCREYDPSGRLLRLVGRKPSGWSYSAVSMPADENGVKVVMRGSMELPLGYHGSITIGRPGVSHICPWRDGKVYDPNHPETPTSLNAILSHYCFSLMFLTMTPNGVNVEDEVNPDQPDLGY